MNKTKDVTNISIEADHDIIFVTVAKYKLFLSYGKIGMDAFLLYNHLMFTARLQGTNSIKAKNIYLRQGLNWGKEKLQKAKNLLYDLDLIETKQKKSSDGKFRGNYIKVKTKTNPFEVTGDPENHLPVKDRKYLNEKDKCLNEELNDSGESPKPLISKITLFWNKLSHTRQHKETSKKTHERINLLINNLRKGKMYNYSFDEDFLESNKITDKLLKKKWTDKEIKKILMKINNMYKDEYWPYDKSRLPRDLDSVIYNRSSQKSFFLICVNNPPQPLKTSKKQKPRNLKIYNKYLKLFKVDNNQKFITMFNDFWDRVQIIFQEIEPYYRHTSFNSYFGSSKRPETFFELHMTWIKQQNNIFPGLLKGMPWKDFVNFVEKEYGFVIEPNNKQKQTIIRDYEMSCKRINQKGGE